MAWDLKKMSVVAAAVGAANIGLAQFAKIDLLSYLGTYQWVGAAVVAAAGVYVLYVELK